MAPYQPPSQWQPYPWQAKDVLITFQAFANEHEKIEMNVDNFLKAAMRHKGEVRLEAMENTEAKKEEEKEMDEKTVNFFLFYRI